MRNDRRSDDIDADPDARAEVGRKGFLARNWLNILGVLGLVLFMGPLAAPGFEMLTSIGSSRPSQAVKVQEFDRETWLAPDPTGEGRRYSMLGSLLGLHPLIGMTRDEVETLLGPMKPRGGPEFGCYDLGLRDGNPYGIEPAGLVLELRDGRVRAWEIRSE